MVFFSFFLPFFFSLFLFPIFSFFLKFIFLWFLLCSPFPALLFPYFFPSFSPCSYSIRFPFLSLLSCFSFYSTLPPPFLFLIFSPLFLFFITAFFFPFFCWFLKNSFSRQATFKTTGGDFKEAFWACLSCWHPHTVSSWGFYMSLIILIHTHAHNFQYLSAGWSQLHSS